MSMTDIQWLVHGPGHTFDHLWSMVNVHMPNWQCRGRLEMGARTRRQEKAYQYTAASHGSIQ